MNCADAPRLLRERREAVQRGDLDLMKAIDQERWTHDPDEETVCKCWQKARREADGLKAA